MRHREQLRRDIEQFAELAPMKPIPAVVQGQHDQVLAAAVEKGAVPP